MKLWLLLFSHNVAFSAHNSDVSFTSSAFFPNASSYFLCLSWYRPLIKHVLHSSLFSLSIYICEQKLKYWAAKCKIQPSDNPIHNHLRYTMLYARSRWIPTLFVVKITLVRAAANFACYVCIHTLPGWSFFYLQRSWIVQERFEHGISFITCSDNIWQLFLLPWKIVMRRPLLFSRRTLQLKNYSIILFFLKFLSHAPRVVSMFLKKLWLHFQLILFFLWFFWNDLELEF